MNKKKIIPVVIIAVLLVLSTLYFEVFRHHLGEGDRIEGSGTIEVTEIDISTRLAGRIVSLPKDEGARVKKGELLVKLQYDELNAKRYAVTAALENARANLNRIQRLYRSGSVSKKDYDNMLTGFRVAKANYDMVQASIGDAVIISPIDGTVLERNLEIGEMAFPGSPMMTVADLTKTWIKIYVTEKELARVKLQQKALISIDSYPDRPFPGRVVSISNRAEFTPKTVQTKDERVKLMYAVKIKVKNPDWILKPGMPADAVILTGGAK